MISGSNAAIDQRSEVAKSQYRIVLLSLRPDGQKGFRRSSQKSLAFNTRISDFAGSSRPWGTSQLVLW